MTVDGDDSEQGLIRNAAIILTKDVANAFLDPNPENPYPFDFAGEFAVFSSSDIYLHNDLYQKILSQLSGEPQIYFEGTFKSQKSDVHEEPEKSGRTVSPEHVKLGGHDKASHEYN